LLELAHVFHECRVLHTLARTEAGQAVASRGGLVEVGVSVCIDQRVVGAVIQFLGDHEGTVAVSHR